MKFKYVFKVCRYIYYIWDLVNIFFWRWGLNLEEKNKIIILYNSLKNICINYWYNYGWKIKVY